MAEGMSGSKSQVTNYHRTEEEKGFDGSDSWLPYTWRSSNWAGMPSRVWSSRRVVGRGTWRGSAKWQTSTELTLLIFRLNSKVRKRRPRHTTYLIDDCFHPIGPFIECLLLGKVVFEGFGQMTDEVGIASKTEMVKYVSEFDYIRKLWWIAINCSNFDVKIMYLATHSHCSWTTARSTLKAFSD